jgi:hypothetical protein
MSLKEKIKMRAEEINLAVIEAPLKNEPESDKVPENTEGISEFAEKFGSRYKIRTKVDKTLWNYLFEIKLLLPLLDKEKFLELHLNLMKILGYFFYISIFIL